MNEAALWRARVRSATNGRVLKFIAWYLFAVAVILSVWAVPAPEERPVILVIVVLTLVTATFELALAHRGTAPFFEIGGFFAAIIWLYACYPLIAYLAIGMTYTPTSESRLFGMQPTPAQMATIGWWYVALLVSFCAAYLIARGRSEGRLRAALRDSRLLACSLVLYGAIELFSIIVERLYSLGAASYLDTYAEIRRLPLFAQQLYGHAIGMVPTVSVLILCALFARYAKNRRYIVLYLVLITSLAVIHRGARTGLFVVLLAATMLYHHLVRPFSIRLAVAIGLVTVLGFHLLGYARSGFEGPVTGASLFSTPSEFEAIFANALDLKYVKRAEGLFLSRPELRFGDLDAAIPQQLLPFKKGAPSDWYLRTYYPETLAAGGGLAFGIVTEAVVGRGWIELPIRGALLGLLFGLLHRAASGRVIGTPMMAFYVWVTMWSYHSVRNTTMPLLGWLLYQFIVPVGLVILMTRIISRVKGRRPAAPHL